MIRPRITYIVATSRGYAIDERHGPWDTRRCHVIDGRCDVCHSRRCRHARAVAALPIERPATPSASASPAAVSRDTTWVREPQHITYTV